jgi:hypothetical protein
MAEGADAMSSEEGLEPWVVDPLGVVEECLTAAQAASGSVVPDGDWGVAARFREWLGTEEGLSKVRAGGVGGGWRGGGGAGEGREGVAA